MSEEGPVGVFVIVECLRCGEVWVKVNLECLRCGEVWVKVNLEYSGVVVR